MDKIETKHDDGGRAFPNVGDTWDKPDAYNYDGLTLRQYAAIKLKVPDSGTDWLDEMIYESLRNDYAGQYLAGAGDTLRQEKYPDEGAKEAGDWADAFVAEQRKRDAERGG